MSHLKCSSIGILLLVLVLLAYSCFFASGEVGKEEKALREKVNVLGSCWKSAYESLVIGCSEILVGEEEWSRIAWNLTDCLRKDGGIEPFPYCDVKSPMEDCLKKLDDDAHMMYLEFNFKTNTICFALQTAAIKTHMERFVEERKRGTLQQEQLIVQIRSRQQEIIELQEQYKKSLEKSAFKQKSMTVAAEKLYTLHKATLLKSRVIATFAIRFCIYSAEFYVSRRLHSFQIGESCGFGRSISKWSFHINAFVLLFYCSKMATHVLCFSCLINCIKC